jgi:hypothetical protein
MAANLFDVQNPLPDQLVVDPVVELVVEPIQLVVDPVLEPV